MFIIPPRSQGRRKQVAIDTTVLAQAEGVGDEERCRVAIGLVERLPETAVLLPAQVLGELMLVLTRKAGRTRDAARAQAPVAGGHHSFQETREGARDLELLTK